MTACADICKHSFNGLLHLVHNQVSWQMQVLKMSELKLDMLEQIVKTNKKMMWEYFLVKKEHCATVADVLVELGGVYSFHPVLKQATLAESIYEYYRSKLISSSKGLDGIMYYIGEVSSDNKCNQLIVSVVKGKRKRSQTPRMILRTVIKVIVPEPTSVGFVRVFDLPCQV